MPDPIETLLRKAAGKSHVIGMGGGLPSPRQFPRRALVQALADAVFQPAPAALQYAWPEGADDLRARIAEHMASRGTPVDPDRILVTSGAQQALMVTVQLLCPRGSRMLTDAETYPGALELFRARGVVPIPFPEGELSATEACAAYGMPAVGNPRGQAMSDEIRRRLLASGVPLIEDDAYGDLRFDGRRLRPLLADAPDRVFFVGTFSKTLAPGLRVGWLVPPERFLEAATRAKRDADLQANGLGQAIVERYLRAEGFEDRLARLRTFYHRRAKRLAAAVRRELPGWRFDVPEGGFALWLEPEAPDCRGGELGLLEAAIDEGLSFDPGSLFRPDRSPHPLALRLCFSALDPADLAEGARRLARAWRRVAQPAGPRREPSRTELITACFRPSDPALPGRQRAGDRASHEGTEEQGPVHRVVPRAGASFPAHGRVQGRGQHHQEGGRMPDHGSPEDPAPERRAAAEPVAESQQQGRNHEQPHEQGQVLRAHDRARGKSHNQ